MRYLLFFSALVISLIVTEAKSQSILSGVYPLRADFTGKKAGVHSQDMFSGSGEILTKQTLVYHQINGKRETIIKPSNQEELLIIIKTGKASVQLFNEVTVLEQGSVIFLLPGDKVTISNIDDEPLCYYTLQASSTHTFSAERAKQGGNSFIMNWKDMIFTPHSKGGVRQLFNRPTAMLNKFDIHITTLHVGMKSHDPHTHKNEEIILLLAGNAEMQIGETHQKASGGDAVWLGSMVLHNLTNIGQIPCLYYAIQWN